MEGDPEYAAAVTQLRKRECTLELFNMCVIKMSTNDTGINMGLNENFDVAAIVKTNLLRETLNLQIWKAQSICTKERVPLVVCVTVDKYST
jgi:hypothetical protein